MATLPSVIWENENRRIRIVQKLRKDATLLIGLLFVVKTVLKLNHSNFVLHEVLVEHEDEDIECLFSKSKLK